MTTPISRLGRVLGVPSTDDNDGIGFFQHWAQRVPHYIIDTGLAQLYEKEIARVGDINALSSFSDIPFERFLLEVQGPRAASFVLCFWIDGWFLFRQAWVFSDGEAWIDAQCKVAVRHDTKNMYQLGGSGPDGGTVNLTDEQKKQCGHSMAVVDTFLFGLRLKGVVQEKVEASEKLNKARARKGKPPIREFTVMRVGHVYDKSGKAHAYTGRTMPVHLRAGHTRRQHYGRRNALTKIISVPPTIVNFTPGAEVKMPKRILTV